MLYMATGKPAHLGCKFLSDVSVVNNPIVVELLVITVLFCVVLPAGSTTLELMYVCDLGSRVLCSIYRFNVGLTPRNNHLLIQSWKL